MLKKSVYLFALVFVISMELSCRETNSNAQTPADANQMEGVRESTANAMETEMERSNTTDPAMRKDSIAKRDTISTKSQDSTKN